MGSMSAAISALGPDDVGPGKGVKNLGQVWPRYIYAGSDILGQDPSIPAILQAAQGQDRVPCGS